MRNVLWLTVSLSALLAGCSSEDTGEPPYAPTSGTSGGTSTGGGAGTAQAGGAAGSGGTAGSSTTAGAAGTAGTLAAGAGGGANGGGAGLAGGGSAGGSGDSSSGGATAGGGAGGGTAGDGAGGAAAGSDASGGVGGNAAGSSGAAGAAGSSGAVGTDPFAILVNYRPTGSLADGYDTWMNEEIGTPVVATEAVADGNINAPILVPPGVTYDGGGQTIEPSINGCNGGQGESQPPVFILVPGASLKNVTINPPGCDGIHMMGDNTLENIEWTDVGEDAASVRSYFPGGAINIIGGSANSAEDKVFQFNAPVQVHIRDFTATNISKLVRQNGGASFDMSVDLVNVRVSGCGEAVVRASSNCVYTHENVTADCPLWRDD
jgi:hypothetical protein